MIEETTLNEPVRLTEDRAEGKFVVLCAKTHSYRAGQTRYGPLVKLTDNSVFMKGLYSTKRHDKSQYNYRVFGTEDEAVSYVAQLKEQTGVASYETSIAALTARIDELAPLLRDRRKDLAEAFTKEGAE